MKISFLVTYYNQKEYVRESIDSILRIKKPDEWEILVGDDGSSDGTTDVVNQYISEYPENIKLFVMPRKKDVKYNPVKRVSANRLNLLEHATGDCFCVLDGDDHYADDDFVEDAIKVFDENPGVTLAAFGYKEFMDDRDIKSHIPCDGKEKGIIDRHSFIRNEYTPGGACVHRKAFGKERIDYIKEIGFFDDNDIVMNSLCFGDAYVFDRVVYAYRQSSNSIYNSMNSSEQNMLNSQGFDVDYNLINQDYYKDLLIRYFYILLILFFKRKKLFNELGKDKYEAFYRETGMIPNAKVPLIMKYDEIDKAQRKAINGIIRTLMFAKPFEFFKMYVKIVVLNR